MAVPTAYLTSTKHTQEIFNAVQRAGLPQRFTYDFLKQLGHPSSSDRPIVSLLKALRFIDDGGQPTDRYRRFKDPALAKAVMAEAVRDAYADVFTVDQEANRRSVNDLKGIFARLSDKGESVNAKMAMTFKVLTEMADFRAVPLGLAEDGEKPTAAETSAPSAQRSRTDIENLRNMSLHHDVHIHLPVSTEIAVYDAIFRSLRQHLGQIADDR